MADKILVFRRGSIGDAIVSLPALAVLKSRFPEAEFRILTNAPVMNVAAPVESLLAGSQFATKFYSLPPGGGSLGSIISLARTIRKWNPDQIFYLSEPSSPPSLIREFLFFKACGAKKISAMPYGAEQRRYRRKADELWESECERLLRIVDAPDNPVRSSWLEFTAEEKQDAASILEEGMSAGRYIAFSIGAKLPDKDWGDENWSSVLNAITQADRALGIILIGAVDERSRAFGLVQKWHGPILNLCGETEPRLSALVMEKTLFYLGHDSGPMHLAAMINVPCVAIFSARAKPGVWFPEGDGHRIFYPWHMAGTVTDKAGFRTAGNSIASIRTEEVIDACLTLVSRE